MPSKLRKNTMAKRSPLSSRYKRGFGEAKAEGTGIEPASPCERTLSKRVPCHSEHPSKI